MVESGENVPPYGIDQELTALTTFLADVAREMYILNEMVTSKGGYSNYPHLLKARIDLRDQMHKPIESGKYSQKRLEITTALATFKDQLRKHPELWDEPESRHEQDERDPDGGSK